MVRLGCARSRRVRRAVRTREWAEVGTDRDEEAVMTRSVGTLGRWVAAVMLAVLIGAPGAQSKSTYVYVHDRQTGGSIHGFKLQKGSLSAIPGSPWTLVDEADECGGMCQTMAYSSKRKMLVTGGLNGITSWTVNKDGSLAASPGSPGAEVPNGDVLGTGVVQIGKRVFVYGSAVELDRVVGFELLADGQFTALSDAALPVDSVPVGLQTRKKLVFVVNQSGTVATFVAQKDGTLLAAPGSPLTVPVVGFIFTPAADPTGKYLYINDDGDGDGGRLHAYSVAKKTGALSPISGTPFLTFPVGGKTGAAVAKKRLFSIDFEDGTNDIQPFTIGKKGVLAETGLIIDSNLPIQVHTIDPKGKQLIVVSSGAIGVAKVTDKRGSLDSTDLAALPSVNANAVVVVKR